MGNGDYRFLWQKKENREARLLRAYGQLPEVVLPEQIAGYSLTEISPYCFSAFAHLPEDGVWEDTYVQANGAKAEEKDAALAVKNAALQELSGSYVTSVVLPDTVRKLGNCAFYSCSALKEIHISENVQELGSDVFMNCLKFDKITVRCGIDKKTGIRQMLAQLSSHIEVYFYGEGGIEAVLFYPEFYESYDEITPAHVFGRKITGEGFRARQSFTDGVVDLLQYDAVFPKACIEEPEKILSRIAMNRLCYPVGLTADNRTVYEAHVREYAPVIAARLIDTRGLDRLQLLFEKRYLSAPEVTACIRRAAEAEWPEGAASMMKWNQSYEADAKQHRYDFDDFL